MKKLLFLAICLPLLATSMQAQDLILKGGVNFANWSAETDAGDIDDDFETNVGFHVGAGIDFDITNFLSVEPGLLFTKKGVRSETEFLGTTTESANNVYYLELPILLKGKYAINDGTDIFAAVGPYVGFGLFGNNTTEVNGGDEESEALDFGTDEADDLRRLDTGLSFGAGATFNSVYVGLFYDLGINNIAPTDNGGLNVNNRVFRVTVGYTLDR